MYADLNLENYVEAEVDGDSAIGSDDDTEGMFLNHPKLISVEPTIPADLPPRTPMKKSATRVEDDTPKEDVSLTPECIATACNRSLYLVFDTC